MSKVIAAFNEIASTSSRNEKIALLKKHDSPVIRFVLESAYNPYRRFNLSSKIADVQGKGTGEVCVEDDYLLQKLQNRELSGNAAVEYVTKFLESLTPDHAAMFKMILNKDLRCGVSDSTINKVFPGLIPEFNVMLAEKPEKIGKMKFPAWIEPKLDGMRAVNVFDGDEVMHLSRSGMPITTLDHTNEELLDLVKNIPTMIDAEAMGSSFNDTMSSVKRKKSKEDSLACLYVFDMLPYDNFEAESSTLTYEARREVLEGLFGKKQYKYLKLNPRRKVNSLEEAKAVFTEFFEQGYEGAIVKASDGVYEFDRSLSWIKLKPLETGDFEITGFEEGTGKNAGKLGAFIVDFNGVETKVGGGFSDKQRKEFWDSRFEMIGTIIEVKYMEGTSNKEGTSRMRHSRFVKVRSLKGAKC